MSFTEGDLRQLMESVAADLSPYVTLIRDVESPVFGQQLIGSLDNPDDSNDYWLVRVANPLDPEEPSVISWQHRTQRAPLLWFFVWYDQDVVHKVQMARTGIYGDRCYGVSMETGKTELTYYMPKALTGAQPLDEIVEDTDAGVQRSYHDLVVDALPPLLRQKFWLQQHGRLPTSS